MKLSKQELYNLKWGYFFISPVVIGIIVFSLGPMLFSYILSFANWDMVTSIKWIGFDNYKRLFNDPLFWKSVIVTLYFSVLNIIVVNIFALLSALLLNTKIRGQPIFRTIFYIPSIVPAVANAALWMFIFNPNYGLLNSILNIFGIPNLNWIWDEKLVIPSLVIMSAWGSGNIIITYLASLQDVPQQLYEAIEIDGGGIFSKFFNITLPMISPVIFYNLTITMIWSLQTFTQGYIMTQGGPNNASLFYLLLLYRTAFKNQEMGYACAMAWVLFIIIAILTVIIFKTSKQWVYYEGK